MKSFLVLGVVVLFFQLSKLLLPAYSDSLALSSSFTIEKVTQRPSFYNNLGRPKTPLGYQFNYFDKFYSSSELPKTNQGEQMIVEWNSSRISPEGETIQIMLSYRSFNEVNIKTKKLDVSVDRSGLYETPMSHTGEEYEKEGKIESWKVTLLKGGKVLDEKSSTLWVE